MYLEASRNLLFRKSDGTAMIVPHYLAHHVGGDIDLNAEEYSEYRWVSVDELEGLEPKIANIPEFVAWASSLRQAMSDMRLSRLQ